MSKHDILELDAIVDGQPIGRPLITIIGIAFCILVSEGFDLSAMGYVAPELIKQWSLTPRDFVPAFSAGIIGMMFGGPLFGFLGDRYGRKNIILAGLLMMAATTLMTMLVRNTLDIVAARFLTGIAMGGVIPNVGALVAELTPKRIRGRVLIFVTLGVPLGIALPGFVAAWLVPVLGWPSILLVGGLLPLIVMFAAAIFLPESIKYQIERQDRPQLVRRTATLLRPDLRIEADTVILASSAGIIPRGSVANLFAGDFAIVTPLMWICQASSESGGAKTYHGSGGIVPLRAA